MKPAAAAQLVFTTPPPDPITSGRAFTVVVSAEDQYGNVSTSFNDDVTLTLPGGGQTAPVQAQEGVATFTGLTVGTTAQGGSIEAAAAALPPVSTPPINVNSGNHAQAPTITGEQVLVFRKKNKRGKPEGKPLVRSITLDFSTAMNPTTAGASTNYVVTAASTKRGKKKTPLTYNRVPLVASYSAATNSVMLTLSGKQTFAKGGQIAVNYSEIFSADNEHLSSDDATLTIAAKGTVVTPG